ncbi:hypothetical protein [Haladaptatus sp. NG-SE-30]
MSRERITTTREEEYDTHLARMLSTTEDIDPEAVDVRIDDHLVTVLRDDTPVAIWPSEAALVADVAASPLLRERVPRWETKNLGVRGQLLHWVRLFLERCPSCDGDLAVAEETVKSCCRTAEVVTLNCEACDSPVLEVEV